MQYVDRIAYVHGCSLLIMRSEQCRKLCGGLLQSEAVSSAPLLDGDDAVASYELRDLPGRRLRRWPRGARRGPSPPLCMWDMLEPYRWPWDD